MGQETDIGYFSNAVCQIQYVRKLLTSVSIFPHLLCKTYIHIIMIKK